MKPAGRKSPVEVCRRFVSLVDLSIDQLVDAVVRLSGRRFREERVLSNVEFTCLTAIVLLLVFFAV